LIAWLARIATGEGIVRRRVKRRIWVGVALVAVLAGITAAAVMAAQPASKHAHRHAHKHSSSSSSSSNARHARKKSSTLATAADYLGVTQAQLRSDLHAGKSLAQVADATSGKSAQGLIQALEAADKHKLTAVAAKLSARVAARVDRTGGSATTHALDAASGYLGLSASRLRSDLHAGETLAQVADSTAGKSEAGLVNAILAARKTALAQEVKDGAIPLARASAVQKRLLERITARVRDSHHSRGRQKNQQ
jgi:hypothetical protein